jgi:hypothetical protein
MTYPDLVPATSGFMEWFFIELMTLQFSQTDGSGLKREIRSSIQEGFKRIVWIEILCPEVPGGTSSKIVYDSYTISGLGL